MRRLLFASCALLASGCFFSLGNPLSFVEGERPLEEKTVEGEGRPKILLLDVSDVITDTPKKRAFGLVEEESTVARVHAELEKAGKDDRVAAVVLRINSPGGGVTASDDIYADIMRLRPSSRCR